MSQEEEKLMEELYNCGSWYDFCIADAEKVVLKAYRSGKLAGFDECQNEVQKSTQTLPVPNNLNSVDYCRGVSVMASVVNGKIEDYRRIKFNPLIEEEKKKL